MSKSKLKNINHKYLCVLKHKENTNEVEVGFIKIKKRLKSYKTELKNLCNNKNNTPKYIFYYLSNHKKLKVLLNDFDYCENLDGPYQEIKEIDKDECVSDEVKNAKENITSTNNKRDKRIWRKELKKAKKYNKNDFFEKFDYVQRIHAFSIGEAYKKCLNNDKTSTFSHRRIGFNDPIYRLSKDFSFLFDTNFGYGKSSYFYTKINYKNIDIVPFADLVLYSISEFEEVIKYSTKHKLKNSEWYNAMKYVKDAYNLSSKDEIQFYKKYIVEQLEGLVNGLNDIFYFEKREGWKFLNKEKHFVDLNKSEHNIIEFKGEKITDSLGFIGILNNYKKTISDLEKYDLESYMFKIEELNKNIKPLLTQEEEKVKNDIFKLEVSSKTLKSELKTLRKKRFSLKKKRKIYVNSFQENDFNISKREIKKKFNKEYPDFKNSKKEIRKKNKENSDLNILKIQYEDTLENLIEYNNTIKEYFKKKK